MPARVIEEWFDAVLAQKEDPIVELALEADSPTKADILSRAEANASKAKATDEYTNLPHRAQKVKDTVKASIKYGLDYQSLTSKSGLSPDLAHRL